MSGLATPLDLRQQAEAASAALPALLLAAEELAATVAPGVHGRRRAGVGEDFWQYRPAHAGDTARNVDWRRSARSEGQFVRDREWQAAQALMIWVDPAPSMTFAARPSLPTKADRARVLALALALLALRGGERVGLAQPGAVPRPGRAHLPELALALAAGGAAQPVLTVRGRAVLISDFLGDPAVVQATLTAAAAQGVRGALLQVLDPVEHSFPYAGRMILHEGGLAHETRDAAGLRDRYLDRLAARRDQLDRAARQAGWTLGLHLTDAPPAMALLWLYQALEGAR